ncbi:MAG: hypothetical protein IKX74_01460 [Erysipelotrichaceae bacterium]|nr:hypothetical protein [Erysipelotrichaceae bacterium]MBR5048306.1 hypothetical protein [Erysipelotrichaceae bacterium]
MSDLKQFKAAIDEIEVTEQQKRKMYSNIIAKAEAKKKRFSLPSLALRLAPALSLCLIVVLAGSLWLNQSMSFAGRKAADGNGQVSDEIQPGDVAVNAPADETSEKIEIDGIVYTLTLRTYPSSETTSTSLPAGITDNKATLTSISWTDENVVFTLSSDQVADEESLLKVRDKVLEIFYQKD